MLPEVYNATDLVIQKKNIFAQLPNVFPLEGLFVPAVLGGTVIRLVSAQIVGLHARAMTVANIAIRLSPVSTQASVNCTDLKLTCECSPSLRKRPRGSRPKLMRRSNRRSGFIPSSRNRPSPRICLCSFKRICL